MPNQKALVITSSKKASVVSDRPIPTLRDDYILVKVVSVALNPTDWKHIEFVAAEALGSLVGCDYSGVVEEVGKNVVKSFKKGDRIYGFAHGSNLVQPEYGAFAEYILVKGDSQFKFPEHLSFEAASTLGLGLHTVGQALYQSLKLALPTRPLQEPVPILIYGGSTATGTLAIQFAKLSGYKVITTSSPSNFDLVKKLGADVVFDYNDPSTAAKIREQTNNNLKLALDTISTESSVKYSDNALSTEGADYSGLLFQPLERENVRDRSTLVYTVFGEPFNFGSFDAPASAEDKLFGDGFAYLAEKLVAEGKVKPHPVKFGEGGLHGVLQGLQSLKEEKVSGQKLVYNVADTK